MLNSFNNGVTTFNGDVGSTNRLLTLATNNDGITRIGGNISTNGTIGFNDAVKLFRDSIIDVSAGQGIFFNSTVDTCSRPPPLPARSRCSPPRDGRGAAVELPPSSASPQASARSSRCRISS